MLCRLAVTIPMTSDDMAIASSCPNPIKPSGETGADGACSYTSPSRDFARLKQELFRKRSFAGIHGRGHRTVQ